ncbi:nicotinate-nucleotide--dimethylbenzimidazole phosphoribosyltransferase [Kitasatospora sp. McL0602]|uniref:nicotinate-nucleotide--dimethylbenzimidazole phosphoribosyltransferase n=1 Tax=Kitasatospora sp. McL0602 TaxID=3439530 RepID=UPI003F8A957E
MTDGGHVPSEGLPEHLLGTEMPVRPDGAAVPGAQTAPVPPMPTVSPVTPVPPVVFVAPTMPGAEHGVPVAQHLAAQQVMPQHGTSQHGTSQQVTSQQVTSQHPAAEGWPAEPRQAFTFLDQPDQLEDEDDVLLMPGPQGSWGEPLAPLDTALAVEPIDTMTLRTIEEPVAPAADAVPGTPVEPSWPPLAPPAVAEPAAQAPPVEPLPVEPLPVEPQAAAPAPAAAAVTAPQQQRRPLHAGPPIPDPSLMTGQVPVRSLADRGPSGAAEPVAVRPLGSTPAHGVPVVQVPRTPVAEPQIEQQMVGQQVVEQQIVEPQAVQQQSTEQPVMEPVPVPVPAAADAPVVAAPFEAAPPVAEHPAEHIAEPVAAAPVEQIAQTEPVTPVAPVVVEAAPVAVEQAPAEQPTAVPAEAEPALAAVAVAVDTAEPVAIPAQAQHRRSSTSAFLAAPAPHDLAVAEAPATPVVEAPVAPEPATEPEPVAVVEAQPEALPEAQPEAQPEALAEPVAVPVAEEATVVEVQPAVEATTEAAPAPEAEDAPVLDHPGTAAPGYDEAGRDAVHQVIRERRDIRNGFRPDAIPHEVLIRVLEAAHTAPSVGYSQPWDFVVIRSAKTRRRMHELAERQRDAYAESLPKGRAKQFKEIKIEAILETPVNIVVTADRTRGGRHTLGRHTQPQMAPYSAALAVENLWLAARAEGLGVGWVSFFDEEEMVRELGLPDHLDVVAYLCVGYVDAFPDEPELQQQGWAKKRPLSWVVHEEQYGNRALPGEEPHDLLSETLRTIRPLDAKALGDAWDRQKRMTKPAGSLGMLEIIAAQLSGLSRKCPPPIPEPGCVAIFAGDHGVHAQGVTPWPQEVTAQMVANFLAGGAVVNSFAAQVGAEVCVVDVGVASELPDAIQQGRTTGLLPRKVKPGTDDMTQGPAMSREEALKAIEVGIETARDLVAAGNKILITGDMGIANTTASAALVSVFAGADPAEVTGRGTGIDDETHARKVEVVRRALALHQPDPSDPIGVLAAVGGLEHAAIAGFLLGAASLRTPVILDGVIAGSAALAAKAIAPEVLAACIAGHRSAEPGHQIALAKIGLRPLIDLDLRLGEGTGALLALPLVQSAARAMHDVATFDSAGVTEKA